MEPVVLHARPNIANELVSLRGREVLAEAVDEHDLCVEREVLEHVREFGLDLHIHAVDRGEHGGDGVEDLVDAVSVLVPVLVDDAVQKGAKIRTGGEIPNGAGYFYPPTVLAGRQIVDGVELGVAGTITAKWSGFASYSFLQSDIARSNTALEIDQSLALTPRHTFNAWTTSGQFWQDSEK